MIRIDKKYTIAEVFSFVKEYLPSLDRKLKVEFDGDMVKPFSERYQVFVKRGTTCCSCGLEGTHFYKEKNSPLDSNYHFNLYGVDSTGKEIMFTKDHIVACSNGGRNTLSNYDTMCSVCNQKKGKMSIVDWKERLKKKHE